MKDYVFPIISLTFQAVLKFARGSLIIKEITTIATKWIRGFDDSQYHPTDFKLITKFSFHNSIPYYLGSFGEIIQKSGSKSFHLHLPFS